MLYDAWFFNGVLCNPYYVNYYLKINPKHGRALSLVGVYVADKIFSLII